MLADMRRLTLELACRNHPANHVVVGSQDDITALEEWIVYDTEFPNIVHTTRLDVTNGFHSVFTELILPEIDDTAEALLWHVARAIHPH